jgi:branched-chain amino acid transport system ATP-binding protein
MASTSLEINNLDVHYGDLQALWNVSLEIGKGRIVSIIGANGAGKSTLLKTIAGTMAPTRGKIIHEGEVINGLKPYHALARGIAMVPEGRRIFPRLTVEENLLVGAYLPAARKNSRQAMQKVFSLFPILGDRLAQLGSNLSGGQQQMLAIGRALMSDPDVILFDEISLGLAPTIIKGIYAALLEINQTLGVTMVLVEQDVQRSLKTAHYAYVLQEGRVALQGRPDEMTEEEVKKAYFGE